MKELWAGVVAAIITAIGAAMLTWATVQTHEYRLDKQEETMETHLKAHDDQNKEIRRDLMDIKEALGLLKGRDR
jgi:chaperonin cofactor prefoldin